MLTNLVLIISKRKVITMLAENKLKYTKKKLIIIKLEKIATVLVSFREQKSLFTRLNSSLLQNSRLLVRLLLYRTYYVI